VGRELLKELESTTTMSSKLIAVETFAEAQANWQK
jgi:hypothetical protein